jgi:secreted trypsin-like serine protease
VAIALASPARADVGPRVLGGRPAPTVEATVALRNGAGNLACSGVLVGPRAVLTAAHCFPLPDSDPARSPRDACFGADIQTCSPVRIVGQELHPRWDLLSFTFDDDLAVVFLEEDAPAAPVSLSARAPAPGETIEIVGYGRTDALTRESSGEKHAAFVTAAAVEDGRVVHGEGACTGDSGGPLFLPDEPGTVVAVTSSGPAGCRDSGRATLVALHTAFIQGAIARSTPAGSSRCTASPSPAGDRRILVFALAILLSSCVRRRKLFQRRSEPKSARPTC